MEENLRKFYILNPQVFDIGKLFFEAFNFHRFSFPAFEKSKRASSSTFLSKKVEDYADATESADHRVLNEQ